MQPEILLNMKVKDLNIGEYGAFYQPYLDICGNEELIEGLKFNLAKTSEFFKSIPLMKHEYSYENGKWTTKELIQHLIDTERIFAYRALRFARNDSTDLPGYDHNNYVPQSKADKREFKELIEEFIIVRNSSISLFKSFSANMMLKSGNSNNNQMSVRAIAFILVGHCNHHCKVIEERYLK